MILLMHIARVVHVFYPDAMVDPFRSYELSLRHVARGHKVTVITWARRGIERKERISKGFEVYRLRGINFRLYNRITEYPCLPKLGDILKNIRADIVHAHSHLFLTTLSAIKEAKRLNVGIGLLWWIRFLRIRCSAKVQEDFDK